MSATTFHHLKTIAQLDPFIKSQRQKNFGHYPNLQDLVKHELINNLEVNINYLDDLDAQINLLLTRSSLLPKIQENINIGRLSDANNCYDLLIKLGGTLTESEIQPLRSSLLPKIQENINIGRLSGANDWYDLLIKLGGTLTESEIQSLRSSLLPKIQKKIDDGSLSDANYGYDLLIRLGGTLQINTHLSDYFNKNQALISLYHPLTSKSLFDLVYFDTFAQSYPFIIEKKDQYKQTIDTHYDAIRSAYMKKSSIKVWEILQGGYPPDEKTKVDTLIKYFDEQAVYKYLAQGTRDPHDAVQHTDELIKMYETEYGEAKKKLFVDTILTQSGSSAVGYYELNNFLIQYKPNRRELLDTELKADDVLTDQRFIGLVESVQGKESSGSLLTSRANLYQLGDLLYLLSQKPALKTIEQLQYSGNPNDRILYEYFATGILSERKKDIQAMLMMYTDPEQFLGLDDENLNNINKLKPFHDAKKPQAMVTDFNHIDMTPADLISALPLGVYDALTYFKPMTQAYITDKRGNISIVDTNSTLGQQEDQHLSLLGNKPLQKLVQDYNNTHKNNNDQMSFRQLKGGLSKLPPTQQLWIRTQLDMKRYTAQIAPKSDISNRYNGFNCDSLGVKHGKKVVMMFNPLCADFCLFDDLPSDKVDNLIATSWLTLNRSIPENITDIKSKIIANEDPRKLFDKSVTKNPDEYRLTLDNIEADENFAKKIKKDTSKKQLLKKIYTLFFSTYIQQHPLSPKGIPINTTKINCGTNYDKIDLWSDTEDNNFLPILLNSYSDNTVKETLKIPINAGEQPKIETKTGIQPMSIEDILSVIYLEGSIYPVGLKDHISNIQHHILASMINNELKQRENLSLVSYDDHNRINGYLLAYQGVMDKKNDSKPCIYVHDVAVDDTGKWKGVAMMMELFEKTKKLDLPILASLRESTSYKIITKKIEPLGYTITQDKQRIMGGEIFHDVVIKKKLVG